MPIFLSDALRARFADAPEVTPDHPVLAAMAARGSCRAFRDDPVPDGVLEVLSSVALSAPTKSDLQQRDIIVIRDARTRAVLNDLVAGQEWVRDAPVLLVFCGNNRRQRLLHDWHGVPFANDHADAMFNAACDAAIALGAFVTAAEAMGLGTCPISAVRNEAAAVSDLLHLPDHVFPMAGLAVGYPTSQPEISPRLPLSVTVHNDRYCEDGLQEAVAAYDPKRSYATQRFVDRFGEASRYGWSEDKVRQYAEPERADFGDFLRAKGFNL